MAKLKIYTFPELVLKQVARPIVRVEKEHFRLADQMLETMYDAPGIGLAANQVGVLQRMLVLDVDYDVIDEEEEGAGLEERQADDGSLSLKTTPDAAPAKKQSFKEASPLISHKRRMENKNPRIVMNPEVVYREGSQMFTEGCLSVPEFTAEVKRAEKIRIRFLTLDGVERSLSAEGLLAVAIQHEMDHLEGRLFIDRLSPLKKEMVKRRLRQERAKNDDDPNRRR